MPLDPAVAWRVQVLTPSPPREWIAMRLYLSLEDALQEWARLREHSPVSTVRLLNDVTGQIMLTPP